MAGPIQRDIFDLPLEQLERYQRGDVLSATRLNKSIDALNRHTGHAKRPNQVVRTQPPPVSRASEVVAVVVLSFPNVFTGAMEVRRIEHIEDPPNTARRNYQYLGDVFLAFIDYGTQVQQYRDFVWSGGAPDVFDTTFLVARKEDGRWFVELPGAAAEGLEQTVVVSDVVDATPQVPAHLMIQRVDYAAEVPVVGAYTFSGPAFVAYPDFGIPFDDYKRVQHRTSGFDLDTQYMQARNVGGSWIASLPAPSRPTRFRVNRNFGDYITAIRWTGFDSTGGHGVGSEILIAKQWHLRRTPFEGVVLAGFQYDYDSNSSRTKIRLSDDAQEQQVLTPSYSPGQIIWATRNPSYGTGVFDNATETELLWLADVDNRQWAKVAEVEEG